jgi:hypothetical protein
VLVPCFSYIARRRWPDTPRLHGTTSKFWIDMMDMLVIRRRHNAVKLHCIVSQ